MAEPEWEVNQVEGLPSASWETKKTISGELRTRWLIIQQTLPFSPNLLCYFHLCVRPLFLHGQYN